MRKERTGHRDHVALLTRRFRAITAALALSVSCVVAFAAPAQAVSTGSYSITTWVQPQIGWVNPPAQLFFSESATMTPPSSVPAGAVITSVTGHMSWTLQPSGTVYNKYLCLDPADLQCANISPTGSWYGQPTWTFNNTQLAGYPADTTSFHVTAFITGPGANGQVLNPKRYLTTTRLITVNYTY